jgi:hypothetical protein
MLHSMVKAGLQRQSERNPDGVPKEIVDGLVMALRTIAPSSTKTLRFRFTASIVRARLSRREFEKTGSDRA